MVQAVDWGEPPLAALSGALCLRALLCDMTRTRWHLAIALAVVVARAAAAASVDAVVMFDSERYRDASDPLAPFRVWDGYGPGVLAQVVQLLPMQAAAVAQTVLAASMWGIAAVYAARAAAPRRSWAVFGAIQTFALSPWFLLWDTWVLTEALTMAGCALCAVGVAAVRVGARGASWVAVAGLAVAVATRPFCAAILLPLVAAALIWPMTAAKLRAVSRPAVATALIAAFAAWQVLTFASTDDAPFSYLPEPESLKQIQATDRLVGRGNLPGYLDLAREAGMPSCQAAEVIVSSPANTDKLKSIRDLRECRDLDEWLATGGLPWAHELLHQPTTTVGAFTARSVWVDQAFAPYLLDDDRVLKLLQGSRLGLERAVMIVNVTMLAFTALAALAALAVERSQRGFVLFALAILAAVSLYMLAVDGIEYWRHALPAFAVLPPLMVTVLGGLPRSADAIDTD